MRTTWDSGGGGLALPSLTPAVKWLLIVNLGLFLFCYFLGSASPLALERVLRGLGVDASGWFSAPYYLPLWQVFTYGWLHDTRGFGHILFNLLQLYFFGTMLEGLLGTRRFLFVYTAGLLAAGVASLILGFLLGSGIVIGASGAILAVLVALAVMQPQTPVILLFVPVPLKWLAIGLVALDAFGLFQDFAGRSAGVAHGAHLAGAAFGFLAARRHWVWIDPVALLEARQRRKAAQAEKNDERRLDELLARIHREGIDSLGKAEREFLKRMSKRQ